jgi:glycosyltransferase involved in cell wall biosynthesis
VYVAGGYLPRGGAYMAYHLGRIVAERFGHECRMVTLKDESPAHGLWEYPVEFEAVSRAHMEAEIGETDLLIANPSFSRNRFGLRLPGRKLMYVQGFGRFPELDGFFDAYVCASEFLHDLLLTVYGIDAPVIPPFAHIDRIPGGLEWARRPPERVLVATKSAGHELLARLQEVMRRDHPQARHRLSVLQPMTQDELMRRMAEHRYFLSLSPREGFGLPQLEAMAAGCAVVGFHGGGGGQFMRPGENCEAVAYPAIEELCGRLATVLTDDGHAERIARAGRETAQGFDLAAFEERWAAFLDGFVRSGAPA